MVTGVASPRGWGGGAEHPWPRPSSPVPVWFCPHPQLLGPKPQGHTQSHSPGGLQVPRAHGWSSGNHQHTQPPWAVPTAASGKHAGTQSEFREPGTQHCLFLEAYRTIHSKTPPVLVQQPRGGPSSPCRVEGGGQMANPAAGAPRPPAQAGARGVPSNPPGCPGTAAQHQGLFGDRRTGCRATLNLQKTVGRSQIHRIRGFPYLGTVPKTCVSDTPSPSRLRPPRGPLHHGVCARSPALPPRLSTWLLIRPNV